ncbi:MAG: hypothetical protein EXS68_00765 [Candidatus Ryanbacteria bacterium]|nr:hypothetical protein [Candidatus Ryanbacteria bacterium]
MSFNRIFVLLPDAFTRIDRSYELTRKRSNETITKALQAILVGYEGQYQAEYRDETVIIYTASAILKHYVHQRQHEILGKLRDSTPQGIVERVAFKGPR